MDEGIRRLFELFVQQKIFELCVYRLNTVDYLNNGSWFNSKFRGIADCLARCFGLVGLGACLIVLFCAVR